MSLNCFKEQPIGWARRKKSSKPPITSVGRPTVVRSWEWSIRN